MRKKIFAPVIIISILISILYVEYVRNAMASQDDNIYTNLKTFAQVLKLVQEGYVEEKSSSDLIEGAIKGLLVNLDAHSSYMNKDSFKEMQVDTEGEFGGLGIEITMKKGILTVVTPIDDTPADRAGVMAGDKILAVDGDHTTDMTLTDAVKKLRGKPNTKVVITVYRDGEEKTRDITIIREIIKVQSTKSGMIDDGIAYIRLINFNKNISGEMITAIEDFKKKGEFKGLILDLRNNPGGLLDQAVKVSEAFLDNGQLVVYTKGRVQKQNMEFKSRNSKPYKDFPIVVLVNQGSASASEIVAGALQDTNRAIILGEQTFGKGSVQTVIPLNDGSAIRLTTSRYYTPAGQVIQENGITPDIFVKRIFPKETPEEKDRKVIREKDLKNILKAKDSNGKTFEKKKTKKGVDYDKVLEKLRLKKNDNQLQSATQLLKGWEVFQKVSKSTK